MSFLLQGRLMSVSIRKQEIREEKGQEGTEGVIGTAQIQKKLKH